MTNRDLLFQHFRKSELGARRYRTEQDMLAESKGNPSGPLPSESTRAYAYILCTRWDGWQTAWTRFFNTAGGLDGAAPKAYWLGRFDRED